MFSKTIISLLFLLSGHFASSIELGKIALHDFHARKKLQQSNFLDKKNLRGNRDLTLSLKVKGHELETYFFHALLDQGDEEDVLEFGPIKVTAECRSNREVALRLHIDWGEDVFVFGDISEDENLNNDPIHNFVLSSSSSYSADMWEVEDKKGQNDPDIGAAWVTDGEEVWYLGLDGDSMIGIGENDDLSDSSDITDIIDDDTECLIAGGLYYYSGDGR